MTTTADLRLLDPGLMPVAEKVLAGERLDRADGIVVATTDDLLGVGRLANIVRERLHGDRTYYNINRHLNPTNVCVASCKLCAFYVPVARPRERAGPTRVEQAVEVAARDVDESVSELHIVGGLHPKLRADYYEELFIALKERFPWVHLKALTMIEFDFIATASRIGARRADRPAQERRSRLLPGRRRRDLRRGRSRPDLRPQDRRPPLARDRPRGPQRRHPIQLHHALRPRRRPPKIGSITSWPCANFRTRPVGSSA